MSAVDYLVALKSELITNGMSNPHKPIPFVNGSTIKNGVEQKTMNGVESKAVNGMENGIENGTENGTDHKFVNGVKSK